MATAPVDSGIGNPRFFAGVTGNAGVGEATLTINTSVNEITEAGVTADSTILVFPTNATAGLLSRLTSVSVQNIVAGQFEINASATGGTPPDGTETYGYMFFTEG